MEIKYGFLFNKKRIILVIFIAAVLIAAGIYLAPLLKKEEAQPAPIAEVEIVDRVNEELQKSELGYLNINFSPLFTVEGEVPTEAPIYTYNPDEITDDFVNNLVSFLKLGNIEKLSDSPEEIVTAYKDNHELYVYKYLGTIIYTNPPDEGVGFDMSLDPEISDSQYALYAERFISGTGFNPAFYTLSDKKFLTYPSTEPVETAKPENAGVIELAYISTVDGFRLIDRTGNLNPNTITVWVDKDYEIRRLNAQIAGSKGKISSNVSIKTKDQLVQEIKDKKAKLISTPINLTSQIESVVVKKAYFAYYSMGERLVPIFILESEVKDANYETTDGYLYIEAVRR